MSQPVVEQEQRHNEHKRVHDALIQAGLISVYMQPLTDAPPLSDEERSMLAERLGKGRPLSELILEDRQ